MLHQPKEAAPGFITIVTKSKGVWAKIHSREMLHSKEQLIMIKGATVKVENNGV